MFRSLVTGLTIITLAFVMSISAGAEEPTHADHCVCGGSVTVGNHAHDTTVPQWTAWNGGAITYTDNVAYIYLSADVTIGSTINVTSGNTLNLCLNGYKLIAGDFTGSALFVADGATLNLTDCSNTTGYGNMDATSGLWTAATESGNCNLTGGVITGFTTSQYGGGVFNQGTFNMYGGNIAGNGAINGGLITGGTGTSNSSATKEGGAIYAKTNATVNIYSGNIAGNSAGLGGGIYGIASTANIYGGCIIGNTQGAINLVADNGDQHNIVNSTLNLHGGKVMYNHAESEYSNEDISVAGNITMTGGTVESQTSRAAIFASHIFEMTGGTVINHAENGFGVYANQSTIATDSNNAVIIENGKIILSGGTIIADSETGIAVGCLINPTHSHYGGDLYLSGNPVLNGGLADIGLVRVNTNLSILPIISGHIYINGTLSTTVPYSVQVFKFLSANGPDIVLDQAPTIDFTNGWSDHMGNAAPANYFVNAMTGADAGKIALVDDELWIGSHLHCICGETHANIGTHMAEDVTPFLPITGAAELVAAATNGGSFYLANDITIDSTVVVASGKTLNLCLNGKILSLSDTTFGSVIKVASDAIFNLTDCDDTVHFGNIDTETYLWTPATESGSCNLTGGIITGGNAYNPYDESGEGGGVYNTGTFTMYGGNLAGNKAVHGGGIYNYNGTLIISGSTIVGNVAGGGLSESCGGGVYSNSYSGILTMIGCKVMGNTAYSGGGVYSDAGTATITDCEITGNTAMFDGGHSGGGVCNSGTLTLTDTTISGNLLIGGSPYARGAGVANYDTMYVSGNVIITGNTLENAANNVYMGLDAIITVNGALGANASIGVHMKSATGIFAQPGGSVSALTSTDAAKFVSDHADYYVTVGTDDNSGKLLLEQIIITFDPNEGSGEMDPQALRYNTTAQLTDNAFTRTGYTFNGWNTAANGSGTSYANGAQITLTDDLTLYAQWTPIPATAPTVTAGSDLNLTYGYESADSIDVNDTVAEGHTVIGYQWYSNTVDSNTNGTAITDATASSYTISTGMSAGTTYYYCVVTVKRDDNGQTTTGTSNTVAIVINKADPDYQIPGNLSATYDDTLADVDLPDGWTWDTSSTKVGNVGNNEFGATFTPSDPDNYNTVSVQLSIAVASLPVAEPTVSGSYTYTGEEQTVVLNGVESFMTVASGDKATNAGSYTAVITLDANHKWDDNSDGRVEWSIEKAKASINVNSDDISVTFGDPLTLPTATTNFGTVLCDKTVAEMVNAGTYTVTYSVTGTDNYDGDSKTVSVIVNRKPVAEPTVSGSYTYTGEEQTVVLNGVESFMTVASGDKATNAGSYTAVITLDGNHKWDANSDGMVEWSIEKAKATVTADSKEVYVGSKMPELTYVVTGLIGTDSIRVDLSCNANMSSTGTTPIVVTASDPNGNYEITTVNATLTVKSAPYVPPIQPTTFGVTVEDDITGGDISISKSQAGANETVTITVTPQTGYKLKDVSVNGGEVSVTKISDTSYSFTMPASAVTVSVTFEASGQTGGGGGGSSVCNHTYGDYLTTETQHYKQCTKCGQKANGENHIPKEHTLCDEALCCSVCNYRLAEAVGHIYSEYTSNGDATCDKDGTKTAKCLNCSETDTMTDKGSAKGHSFRNYTADGNATCDKDGTKTATCENCDTKDTVTDAGSAKGHSFKSYTADGNATCDQDGTKTATCENCDTKDTVADTGSAKGHSFKSYTADGNATCDQDGTKTATCEDCAETDIVVDEGSIKEHNFEDASCTECGIENPDYRDFSWLMWLIWIIIVLLIASGITFVIVKKTQFRKI